MQGLSAADSVERARSSFVDLTVRNWKFWIPAQLAQFALLPEEWQVPYTCAMGLVWNIILSAAAGSATAAPATQAGMVVPSGQATPPTTAGWRALQRKARVD